MVWVGGAGILDLSLVQKHLVRKFSDDLSVFKNMCPCFKSCFESVKLKKALRMFEIVQVPESSTVIIIAHRNTQYKYVIHCLLINSVTC